MGVSFKTCKRCGYNFPDCGEYVWCDGAEGNCESQWCSEFCASEDGFRSNDDDETSCGYCRNEKITDEDLLEFVIDKLKTTRRKLEKECIKANKT